MKFKEALDIRKKCKQFPEDIMKATTSTKKALCSTGKILYVFLLRSLQNADINTFKKISLQKVLY